MWNGYALKFIALIQRPYLVINSGREKVWWCLASGQHTNKQPPLQNLHCFAVWFSPEHLWQLLFLLKNSNLLFWFRSCLSTLHWNNQWFGLQTEHGLGDFLSLGVFRNMFISSLLFKLPFTNWFQKFHRSGTPNLSKKPQLILRWIERFPFPSKMSPFKLETLHHHNFFNKIIEWSKISNSWFASSFWALEGSCKWPYKWPYI